MLKRRSFLHAALRAAGAAPLVNGVARAAAASPLAETTAGKIRGSLDNKIYSFKGVPYGASTEGARFLPPTRPKPWNGTREMLQLGLRAPQLPANLVPEYAVMDRTGPMGEDCLCLNVWSQGMRDNRKRPVMVWLHGGGFTSGSAGFTLYDGANLAAKHDVVVVGVNHRLNAFGFLYLAEIGGAQFAQASNAGMLDIVLALEWVRDNIEQFGGDPDSVTVFGQSGGGGKVSALLGMPQAKGLFHRAIAMSGSAVKGVSRADATKTAEAILDKLNLKASQVAELQKVPMQRLLDATAGGSLRLAPVVDGRTIPADPFDPMATEISSNIPLMIGSTETEVTWSTATSYEPLDDKALRGRVKQTLRADDQSADRAIAVYRKNRPQLTNLDLYLILASDASNFRIGTDTEADRKAAQAKAAVYKYYFQWYSPVREGKLRSMHTMDIPFVFQNVNIAKSTIGEGAERQPLADKMSAAWAAFARSGNPNTRGLASWPAYTPARKATMIFNNECKAYENPFGEERAAIAGAASVPAGRA